MSDNLKLWKSVEKTDPKHTKKAKIGQMSITAIAPQYQRKNATEIFGPYGLGWGVENESWDFMDFTNGTKIGTYSAVLWYDYEGKRGELPITSNIKVCYVTKNGEGYLMVDDEFAKKGQTDAITKGLSALGFNADVFMGLYDDSKYVNQMKKEFSEPHMTREEAVAKIKGAKTLDDLKKAWTEIPVVLRDEELVALKDDAKNDFTNNQ